MRLQGTKRFNVAINKTMQRENGESILVVVYAKSEGLE
jgi:hypothetical protein